MGVLNFSIHNRYKGIEKCVWRERDRGEAVRASEGHRSLEEGKPVLGGFCFYSDREIKG